MRIAIDAHSVGTGLGGNESYATNLIEALAEIDAVNRYTLYVTKRGGGTLQQQVAKLFRSRHLAAYTFRSASR